MDTFSPASIELTALFEDILSRGLSLRIRVTGRSMTPFLCEDETVIIRKISATLLRKGDLIFFKDPGGCPVIHRILRKGTSPDGTLVFETKGDALTVCDELVQDKEVLGKVCKVERGGRLLNLETRTLVAFNYFLATIGFFEARLCHVARSVLRYLRVGGKRGGGIT